MANGKGRIVVLEGLDGCGKGAQIREIQRMVGYEHQRYPDVFYHGRRVTFTREPGGTDFAEKIRTLFKEGMETLSGKTQFFNCFAARNDHWERIVIPAVQRGDLVICDRADASTFAYQVHGQNSGEAMEELFWAARKVVYGEYEPDVYFFIDVSPEECKRRILEALTEGEREVSNFDARNLDFHRRVRDGYLAFGKTMQEFITINGERSVQLVHNDIRLVIDQLVDQIR